MDNLVCCHTLNNAQVDFVILVGPGSWAGSIDGVLPGALQKFPGCDLVCPYTPVAMLSPCGGRGRLRPCHPLPLLPTPRFHPTLPAGSPHGHLLPLQPFLTRHRSPEPSGTTLISYLGASVTPHTRSALPSLAWEEPSAAEPYSRPLAWAGRPLSGPGTPCHSPGGGALGPSRRCSVQAFLLPACP